MSKSKKKRSSRSRVPSSVAAAMRAANSRGQYGATLSTKRMIDELGAMTRGMYSAPKKKHRRTKAEKAARKRVLSAHRASAARAARLPGKKRSKVAPRKKTSKRRSAAAAAPSARRSSKKRLPTVTAAQVINNASKQALRRWLCEGARRSGCGAGGSRVVTGKGSFKRIRPPRFMTSG